MYRAGYDPQAFIQFFEKIDALEKHKPGTLAKVFADHPQTPDRINRTLRMRLRPSCRRSRITWSRPRSSTM
jgi:predicted Zn-dependent protease